MERSWHVDISMHIWMFILMRLVTTRVKFEMVAVINRVHYMALSTLEIGNRGTVLLGYIVFMILL
jgi:hypothetical protein